MRRVFISSIAWPMIQLGLAAAIVGVVILALGFIAEQTGQTIDILGFGLVGWPGFIIYVLFLSAVLVGALVFYQAARRGLVWTRPLRRLVAHIPALGPALRTFALARLTWSLHLTLNTGMDTRRALRLSIQGSQHVEFLDQADVVDRVIAGGGSITEAFRAAGVYPIDFLDAVRVAEDSGRLVESMGHLAEQYRDRARAAMTTLTTLAGVAVWLAVAALIIMLIFRIFSFYIGTIREATQF